MYISIVNLDIAYKKVISSGKSDINWSRNGLKNWIFIINDPLFRVKT